MKKFATLIGVLLLTTNLFYADDADTWGAAGAKKNKNPTVADMLEYAIEDEYLARAEYAAIIKKFGEIKPFSNIIKAEEQHIKWLKDEYKNRNMKAPEDQATGYVIAPLTVKESIETGITAEIENIDMYKHFLDSPELKLPENSRLRLLFTQLMQSSQNHLEAFKKNQGKY